MKDKKNIERLFQEKFKDFDAAPPEHIWSSIETSLDNKGKQNRKVIPIWWRLGGAAAAVALLLLLGSLFLNTPNNAIPSTETITNKPATPSEEKNTNILNEEPAITPKNAIAEEENNEKETLDNIKNPATKKEVNSNNTRVAVSEKSTNKANNNTSKNPINYPEVDKSFANKESSVANKEVAEDNNLVAKNLPQTEEEKDTDIDDSKKRSLLDVVAEMEKEETEVAVNEPKASRWSVNPNIAPVYYNSLSKGSPINREFSSNSKEGAINMSYGINVAYNVSKRLSVRSGVNNVNMGYSTNNIEFSPAVFGSTQSLSTVTFNRSDALLNVSSSKNPSFSATSEFQGKTDDSSEGTMNQEFGYIEVPMELKYRLLDKKFGINIIGGVSSLFLTNNEVTLQSNNLAAEIGEANNLNDLSFSTNIGLGVDYQVSNKLLFNIEPMFKYQLNTFSREDGGFSPYILGVYSGLSFKF
ncbi:PorT family protein [Joostella atrarenae]|uniref:PorT family protein n=1 Tax=Joostella atrarenae TaxID=679257 RepID=A0ABS9J0B0_9FLAO|nr:outer membrane beta-barrel protein [Joostella atrarenae]MCF8713869.1 PorT family protein [Joostella atrarenae]